MAKGEGWLLSQLERGSIRGGPWSHTPVGSAYGHGRRADARLCVPMLCQYPHHHQPLALLYSITTRILSSFIYWKYTRNNNYWCLAGNLCMNEIIKIFVDFFLNFLFNTFCHSISFPSQKERRIVILLLSKKAPLLFPIHTKWIRP